MFWSAHTYRVCTGLYLERERQGEGKSKLIWGKPNKAGQGAHKPLYTGGTATTFQVASAVGRACRLPLKSPKWHRYSALCAWSHHEATANSRNTLPVAKKQSSGVARSLPKQLQAPRGMSPCSGSTSLRPHVAPIPTAAQAAATSPGSQLESL